MLEKLPEVIGHALRRQRAGLDKLAFSKLDLRQGMAAITVGSLAFADHAPMPARYTSDGDGHSPPLQWTGVPTGAAMLVLIVEDADAPTPQPLVHAIAVGLAPGDGMLSEGALNVDAVAAEPAASMTPALHLGRNSTLRADWLPPDPPPGHGVHRYAFQVFALADAPTFSDKPGRDEVLDALALHAIASGMLIGTYERPDGADKVAAGRVSATAAEFSGG